MNQQIEIPRVLATTSEEKKKEWQRILTQLLHRNDFSVDILYEEDLGLREIQSLDPVEVAVAKAVDAAAVFGSPILVEDVSLALPELNGFPGPMYKIVEQSLGLHGLIALADRCTEHRAAIAMMTIAFADAEVDSVYVVKAEVLGTITCSPRGENGFSFDSIFQPEPFGLSQGRTFAEMMPEQKDFISMRGMAIKALLNREWEQRPSGELVRF